jgi:cell division protein ZipA
MDGLRWLLLLIGSLVIAGVYWYSRREASRSNTPEPSARREPMLGDETADDAEVADSEPEPDEDDAAPPSAKKPAEKIVTLRLVAGKRAAFPGDELALGLRAVGMRHGRFGIYHRYAGDDESKIIFSAASLVEPGSFDLANLKEQTFPGISLFLVLPGPVEGAEAFDMMMSAARSLAKSLQAELLDESGSTLSIQRERYMREEIIQYQHGIKVA